jgi:signal peptidase I
MASNVDRSRKKAEDGGWETIKVIVQALLIAFVVRTFFFQPFNIPSESMVPTLRVGDYLFVNKLSYGYSKYSFNFSFSLLGNTLFKFGPMPIVGRVFAGTPERGDVVVFKLPTDNETDYIKRVIGLPGDRIQMIDGLLHINGEPVKMKEIDGFVNPDHASKRKVRQDLETLPNGVKHRVIDIYNSEADNTQVYTVPEGHYFMMGDNRDNSTDSRFLNEVGYVPYENLVGRATILFFSHGPDGAFWEFWKWPTNIRWGRLFNFVE